jgi:hypothetical protein
LAGIISDVLGSPSDEAAVSSKYTAFRNESVDGRSRLRAGIIPDVLGSPSDEAAMSFKYAAFRNESVEGRSATIGLIGFDVDNWRQWENIQT